MRNEQIKAYALRAYNHVNKTEFVDYHELPERYRNFIEEVHDTYEAVAGHPPSGLSRQLISLATINYRDLHMFES